MVNSRTIEKSADMICKILLIIVTIYFLYLFVRSGIIKTDNVQKFSALFSVIVIEGFPFILIGSFISAVISSYVSEELIIQIIDRTGILSIFTASFAGILFPVCECGIVSIIKKLLNKKLPLHLAVTLMISVPIINPVVILTTVLAFYGRTDIVIFRIISGILVSNLVGLITYFKYRNTEYNCFMIETDHQSYGACTCHSCSQKKKYKIQTFFSCIDHAIKELYSMGRYFIIGSFIAAFMRTFIPISLMSVFSENTIASILFMLFLAFCMSVCSESDAFIARKFSGIFPDSAIIGFLVLGPMLDMKNTVMLLNVFKKEVVFFLIITIIPICFLNSLIISLLF